jgi:hypothetical protein
MTALMRGYRPPKADLTAFSKSASLNGFAR